MNYYKEISKMLGVEPGTGGYHDLLYWKAGNCFETREEAIAKGGENIKAIRKEFEEA